MDDGKNYLVESAPPEKPKCYDRLHELRDVEWDALHSLRLQEVPPPIPEEVMASLQRRDLVLDGELTHEGRLAAAFWEEFRLEQWDYSKDGRTWKSAAVVASDGNGNDVLLHAMGPAIDWHIDQFSTSCDELGLSCPEPGVWVWVGTMGSVRCETMDGVDYDHEVTGDWRAPTDEEWEFIKGDECPWDKDTLPRWNDGEGPRRARRTLDDLLRED